MFFGISVRILLLAGLFTLFSSTGFASSKFHRSSRVTSSSAKMAKQMAISNKSPKEVTVRLPNSRKLVSYDARMLDAAQIAKQSARSHSISRCWRYVKRALVAADLVDSYPKTAYAKQAAAELSRDYGFTKIPVTDPFAAPEGSVLVYGGRGAGHVEIRTKEGFVSDHASVRPSPRPLIGVFVKPGREG